LPRPFFRWSLPSVLLSVTLFTGPLLPVLHADSRDTDTPDNANTESSDAPAAIRPVLSGSVTDPTGALIPGATILLTAPTASTYSATADPSGHYSFLGVPAGNYQLVASAAGFATRTLTSIPLDPAKPSHLDLKMQIETTEQSVQVTPGSDASDTSPHKNSDAIVLKGSDLDLLSTNNSQALQQLQAIAGTGGDGSSPQLYVDGFSNGTMPPKDTIREIRINNDPYSAEYDSQGFNRIQIFTKPGSDKVHGSATGFGTDSSFDSRNPFSPGPQPFHQFEIDADLEGPIGKKTSFLLGFLRTQIGNSAIVNAETLDANLQQILLTSAVDNPTIITGFTTRIDRAVSAGNTLVTRVDIRRTTQDSAGVGQLQLASQGYNDNAYYATLQVSDTQVFGTKIVNDAHFQYKRSRDQQSPVTAAPALVVQGAFTGGGSALGSVHDNQDQYELQDYATFDLGKHFLRTGIRQRFNRDANRSTANFNGQYIFSTLDAYQLTQQGLAAGFSAAQIRANGGGASQFTVTTGSPSATVMVADTSLFAEDTWKATKHLTASLGLRYEAQNRIGDTHDFAPRLATTYNIGGTEKTPPLLVLQTGFGIFYTRFPSADLLQSTRLNGITESQFVLTNPDDYPAIPTAAALAATQQGPPTVYRLGSHYQSPYSISTGFTAEHNFKSGSGITLGYSFARGVHLLLSRNVNAPLPGTYNPADPTSGVRPFGDTQNIYEYDTQGISNRSHVYLNAHIKAGKIAQIFANYNYGFSHSDTNGNFPSSQYNVGADYGRDTGDAHQRLFLGEFFDLPYHISGGTFLIAQSGAPFDIELGQDLNGDSQFNDRPAFATDLTRTSVVQTRYGNFDTLPIAGQRIIPRNYGQGPGLLALNSYWEKGIPLGPVVKPPADVPAPKLKPGEKPPAPLRKYMLTGAVELDNLLNHVNDAPPVGTLGSPLFGKSNAVNSAFSQGSANRQVYFILSFHF
jgi:hypothetical protein